LREYSPEDFDRLWELDQRCFPTDIAYSRRELAHYLSRKTAICLIAEKGQTILGFIVGQTDPRRFGHVITLDVELAERKLGIGSTLMQALEQRFREANYKSILLEVAVNNREGLSFYKKHGYSVLKILRHYYPGDLDGILMGKRLQKTESRS
jgi:ribosomal-protein-alanine N-acetyltransferase